MRPSKSDISQRINGFMVSTAAGTKQGKARSDFRCSSMPYCGIRTFMSKEESFMESCSMDFYTGIGTSVHDTIQKWAMLGPLGGRIVAQWKCGDCKHIHKPMFLIDTCQECGCLGNMQYEEITISYKGLSGHVDLLLEVAPGYFVVVDFKTTNLTKNKLKFPKRWKSFYPAVPYSQTQLNSYAALLTKIFGYKIVATALVYVDRGQVIKNEDDYYTVLKPWNKRKQKKYMRYIDQACVNNKLVNKLQALVNEDGGHDPYAVKVLKNIVMNRPCVDEASYKDWMGTKFHKWSDEQECRFKNQCLCSNKAIYRKVIEDLSTQ